MAVVGLLDLVVAAGLLERERGVDWWLGRGLVIGPEEMVVVWVCGCSDLGHGGCDLFK